MGFLSQLFKSGNEAEEKRSADYKFLEINASELVNYPKGITDIKERNIDGFLIRGVLTKEEAQKIVTAYENVPDEEKIPANVGLICYPQAFSQLDQNSKESRELLQGYFRTAESFWANFEDRFKIDFVQRIKDTLGKIADGRAVEVPKGLEDIGSYNPATIKEMSPGDGELKAHCGNFFHEEFPTFYGHLMESSIIKNQMSYFVMLEPPEGGGELTLYDLEWDNVKKRLHGDTVLEDDEGNQYDLLNEEEVQRKKLKPGPGDMIVFAGGQIWHKVEFVRGSRPRYTIGGFMSKSKDDKTLYFWS